MIVRTETIHLEGVHTSVRIERRGRSVVLLSLTGKDAGELGSAPFEELDRMLADAGTVELFIDASASAGATIDVSNAWASWFARNKPRLRSVTMFAGSRLIAITAEFVKRWADLGDTMRLTESGEELARLVAVASGRPTPGEQDLVAAERGSLGRSRA
jgi:hypothetical protein